jgi:hypothetical protein
MQKFLRISSKNELLLKKFPHSKHMNLLDIKTYHYDIFMTNTIDIMEVSKTYFLWCNLSFSPSSLTQHVEVLVVELVDQLI